MRPIGRIPEKKRGGLLCEDLLETASFILRHPLNDTLGGKAGTFWRYLSWQIRGRLHPDSSRIDFVGQTGLLVKRGVAQRRIGYMPLHEFEEMAFVVHALREGDLFLDVGANIGAYAVLAGSVAGATAIACEPIPANYALLQKGLLGGDIRERMARGDPWDNLVPPSVVRRMHAWDIPARLRKLLLP